MNIMTRQEFIKYSFFSALGLATGLAVINVPGLQNRNQLHAARPPGALDEKYFESACIRCGKCALVCPYESIIIADGSEEYSIGTPYLILRKKPCYLCSGFPCIEACPTDALDDSIKKIEQVRMGTAVITDREACLSLRGLRCEVCYRVCPLIDRAIIIVKRENPATGVHTIFEPVIQKNFCVGCGICEHVCVLDESAIKVISSTRGDKSRHYFEQPE